MPKKSKSKSKLRSKSRSKHYSSHVRHLAANRKMFNFSSSCLIFFCIILPILVCIVYLIVGDTGPCTYTLNGNVVDEEEYNKCNNDINCRKSREKLGNCD